MKSSTHETLSLQSFLRIYLWPSPIALLLVCAFIFRLFDLYDETRCLARVGAYLFIFFVILSFPKNKKGPLISGPLYGLEIALLTLVVAFALYQGTLYFSSQTDQLVKIDIGYYTQYSSQVFFRAHLNPYEGKVLINHLQDPQFSGYKHGPLMFLAYFASSYLPVSGLKVTNLVFLGLTAVMLIFLSWERHRKNLANIAMVMFSLAALFVSQRLWFELFSQGANDIFPILLVLAAFLLLRMKLWFFAGLLAGLSLSAKAAPGIVLTLLLIRKDFKPTYFLGVLAGLTPVLYFLWWNPQAMIKNYFIFHITKDYDTSSLYSVIPTAWHFLLPLGQVSAALFFIAKNFYRPFDWKEATVDFTLLLILLEIFYREVHGNHTLFFIPLVALIFAWHRYSYLEMAEGRMNKA